MPKPNGSTIKDVLRRCPPKPVGGLRITIFLTVWDVVCGDSFVIVRNPLTEAFFSVETDADWRSAWLKAKAKSPLELKRLVHQYAQQRRIADLPEKFHATPVAEIKQPALFA
jgi:hypothetical protein